MRKVVDVLAASIIVALVWFCSQLISQAADKELEKAKIQFEQAGAVRPDGYAYAVPPLSERFANLTKAKAELLVLQGRTDELQEQFSELEKEVKQLVAEQQRTEDEAWKKLVQAKALLVQITKDCPTSQVASIAKRMLENGKQVLKDGSLNPTTGKPIRE